MEVATIQTISSVLQVASLACALNGMRRSISKGWLIAAYILVSISKFIVQQPWW